MQYIYTFNMLFQQFLRDSRVIIAQYNYFGKSIKTRHFSTWRCSKGISHRLMRSTDRGMRDSNC